MKPIQILVIDLGSQYTLIIERTLRELGYRSAVLPPEQSKKWLISHKPNAIILSGGSFSVHLLDSPKPPGKILTMGIPILGICYGMQWLATELGGHVITSQDKKEYGKATIVHNKKSNLFENIKGKQIVWASHGDSIDVLPKGFRVLAKSSNNQTIEAIGNSTRKIWGLQFHPEVTHTENGKIILQNFLKKISHCQTDWAPKDIITNIQQTVRNTIGNQKAIIGFSGGVDSSTLSAVIAPSLGKQLLAIGIDTGALRKYEIKEMKTNAKATGVNLKIINASRRFQKALRGLTHSEKKRQAFKKLYVKILEEAAKQYNAKFIIQGSLATDFIESGKVGKAVLIKSHHNIGNQWHLTEIHPFGNLFKYEVRALAQELKLPKSISERQPFPGPGLFIRIVGTPVTLPKLAILKEADATVTKILKKRGVYKKLAQLVVGLIGVKTVGIKGDGRSYEYPILVRGVQTRDFMTVSGFDFPPKIKKEIEKTVTKHARINRVWWCSNDKPPATTELE